MGGQELHGPVFLKTDPTVANDTWTANSVKLTVQSPAKKNGEVPPARQRAAPVVRQAFQPDPTGRPCASLTFAFPSSSEASGLPI